MVKVEENKLRETLDAAVLLGLSPAEFRDLCEAAADELLRKELRASLDRVMAQAGGRE